MAASDNNQNIINSINNSSNQIRQSINTVAANQVKINKSIQDSAKPDTVAVNITEAVENLEDSLIESLQDLGDGIKLTLKEKNDEKEKSLKEELDGLKVFIPECGEIADLLIAINTHLTENVKKIKKDDLEGYSDDNIDTGDDEDLSYDTSAESSKDLAGFTSLVKITGTGFSIVSNILTGMKDLFASVLEGITPGQLQQYLVTSELKTTTTEIQKSNLEKDDQQQSKGKLATFFQGISGPLESIAASTLMLSLAIGILTQTGISGESLATVLLLNTFMLTMFTVLATIQARYSQNPSLLDEKSDSNISTIIKQFTTLLVITAASMLFCSVLVEVLKPKWLEVLTGVAILFGTTFLTLIALSAVAYITKDLVAKDSPLNQLISNFAILVFTIAGLAILCALLKPQIEVGMWEAIKILTLGGVVVLTLVGISALISKLGVSAEQIEAFKSLLVTTTILISIISVLTIILGLIPADIINQGIMNMSIIVGLVAGILLFLSIGILAVSKISTEQLQAFSNLLIVTTVMIGLLSVLVIVLGFMDKEQVMQGVGALVVIATIPVVLTTALAFLGKNKNLIAQASAGLAAALVVTLAITGLAWVIINVLGQFTQEMVINSMLAVTWTAALVVALSFAIVGLGLVAPATIAAAIPALAVIGIATGVVAALSLITLLIASSISSEKAQNAIQGAKALIVVTGALVIVSAAIVALGALAIPLALSSTLALVAIGLLSGFLGYFTSSLTATINNLAAADIDTIGLRKSVTEISQAASSLKLLNNSLVSFNLIALTLVANIIVSNVALIALNAAMLIFVPAYIALQTQLSLVKPTNQDNIRISSLSKSIKQLDAFSKTVNNFSAPSLTKMAAVSITVAFISRLSEKLKKIGDDETIAKVSNLATNLSALANNASGLSNLAQSINEVAQRVKQ